jgi:hypothetical protein
VRALAAAYDRDGKPLDQQVQTVTASPPPGAREEFEYELVSRLRLKPGRHEIRVALEDVGRQVKGSVYTYVTVPDFLKAPLSLSGVVLGTRLPTSRSAFHDLLPVTPTVRREFSKTDRLMAFARVYQGGRDPLVPVTVMMRIVDAQMHTMAEGRTPLFEEPSARSRAADYRVELPLASLAAGPYLLTIEATRGAKQTAREDVRFTMR